MNNELLKILFKNLIFKIIFLSNLIIIIFEIKILNFEIFKGLAKREWSASKPINLGHPIDQLQFKGHAKMLESINDEI